MALNFPHNKNTGDTHIENGITFTWDGTVWKRNGNQNIFSTIAVSGQNNVVADGATDTLTLVGTSGVSITTNSSTDTVTFSSSGGSTPAIVLSQLSSNPTTNSTSYQNAITLSINPTVSGSKLLICAGGQIAGWRQDYYDDPEQAICEAQLFRGSTALGNSMTSMFGPDNTTSYIRSGFYLSFVDTNNHGGNSVTYHLKYRRTSNSDGQNVRVISGTTLTIQEII